MRLLTPALTEMATRVNETYSPIDVTSPAIVINEINYHSADELDTGDWVELYNPNDLSVDLSGWYFQDGNIRHSFALPEGTLVEPRGFLVLCQDRKALEWLSGTTCIGDFDFGLRNSGELVSLFDRHGLQVDSIAYGDSSPWPEEADGDGPTLELRHYELDNSEPSNWLASISPGGTPGGVNSAYEFRGTTGFVRFTLSEAIPNPFVSTVRLELDLAERTPATLKVYNALGQMEEILADEVLANGISQFTWNPRERGAGVYFISLYLGRRLEAVRKAVYLGG